MSYFPFAVTCPSDYPLFTEGVFLSDIGRNYSQALKLDSSCLLSPSILFLNYDFCLQTQFCIPKCLQDPCAECHHITKSPDPMCTKQNFSFIRTIIQHHRHQSICSHSSFPQSHLVTTKWWVWEKCQEHSRDVAPHGPNPEPQAADASLQTSGNWQKLKG